MVLGADGRPLRPAVLWNDTRSGPQTERLVAALGREGLGDRISSVPVPSITVTRWAWLRETGAGGGGGDARECGSPDFLTERLCGRGVTDRGDASGTSWWSTRGRVRQRGMGMPGVALDPAMLPEVLPPDGVASTVTEAAAAFLGIRAGIPVGPGSGDNAGAALGLRRAGTPVISLGTSGVAYAVSVSRPVDPGGMVAGFADASEHFLPLRRPSSAPSPWTASPAG
ncbi:MAG: FGGY family carbohydrate kinase [Chloroflexota bacterium]